MSFDPRASTLVAGRYAVQKELARGGTADVFGVYDTNLKIHRALKVAARPTPQEARVWLRREFEFLSVHRSPFFPNCFDWLEAEGAIVMEYCPGYSLADPAVELKRHPTAVVAVARRLLLALEAVHSSSYVFRDLKPDNLIVPKQIGETWRLVDFGSLCPRGPQEQGLGTPGFAAPEIVSGASATPQSDFYSLGQCLKERFGTVPSPVTSELISALTAERPSQRPLHDKLQALLSVIWAIEAWATPGGVCFHCFAPLRSGPQLACDCPLRLDVASLQEASTAVVAWAERRGALSVAPWVLERTQGSEGLSPDQRVVLAGWHQGAGRADDALRVLSPAAQPESSPPPTTCAPLHLRLTYEVHGVERAVDDIRRWQAELVVTVEWCRNAAQILMRARRQADAKALLLDALKAHPEDGPCHALLARLLDGEERRQHMWAAAAGDPPDRRTVRMLAEDLVDEGRFDQAVALVRDALARLPGNEDFRVLLAELSIRRPESWPTLEADLRAWVTDSPSDKLLECLVDLYVRSERWARLLDSQLPHAQSPATRALVKLARIAASKDWTQLVSLNDFPWRLASGKRWISSIAEVYAQSVGSRRRAAAEAWLSRLPDEFAHLADSLRSLEDS